MLIDMRLRIVNMRCFILLLPLYGCMVRAHENECDALFQGHVGNCSELTRGGRRHHRDLFLFCNETTSRASSKKKCKRTVYNATHFQTNRRYTSCNKHLKLSIFNQQLFAITMKNAVKELLAGCCRDCARCSVVNKIDDLSLFAHGFKNNPDIIFPIIGKESVRKLHGYHFVPSFNVPDSYYFTPRKPSNQIILETIYACLKLWPLFLACVLLALISGFIIWIIETHKNPNEFRSNFYYGLFDGFWWSIVAMTTLGFGDQVPKSIPGRLYSIMWVFVGMTICSIFTASLISDIIKAKEGVETDLHGQKIGVLKNRLHDIAIVSEHGGVLYQTSIYKTMSGINELLSMLDNKTIDGFLIDQNTYFHFSLISLKKEKHKHIGVRFGKMRLSKSEKKLGGERLQCGTLIKSEVDYEYFKTFFADYRIHREACNTLRMNSKREMVGRKAHLFSTDANLFKQFMIQCVIILAVFFMIGTLFELKRYHRRRHAKADSVKKSLVA